MGKVIAVVNQKGGVGKTTSAVNLTAALTEAGKKVLLCDFDPQANATSGMGVDKRKIKNSIYDVTINGVPLEETYLGEPMDTANIPAFTLEEDMYFLMGDNRNNSADSRYEIIGTVDVRRILGKVILRVTPFDKFGIM